jgi:hypothetical protein
MLSGLGAGNHPPYGRDDCPWRQIIAAKVKGGQQGCQEIFISVKTTDLGDPAPPGPPASGCSGNIREPRAALPGTKKNFGILKFLFDSRRLIC